MPKESLKTKGGRHIQISLDDMNLYNACVNNNPDLVQHYLQRGANPLRVIINGQTTLYIAVGNQNIDICTMLLNFFNNQPQGLKRTFVNWKNNPDNYTALHLAAALGDWNICELLLQHGADLNAKDNPANWNGKYPDGATPADLALENDDPDLANELRPNFHGGTKAKSKAKTMTYQGREYKIQTEKDSKRKYIRIGRAKTKVYV